MSKPKMSDTEQYSTVAIFELSLIKKDRKFNTYWEGLRLRSSIRWDQEAILKTNLNSIQNKFGFLQNWEIVNDQVKIEINQNITVPQFSPIQIEKINESSLRRALLFKLYEEFRKQSSRFAMHSLINEVTSLEVSEDDIRREVDYLISKGLIEYKVIDGGACTCSLTEYGLELSDSLDALFNEFKFLSLDIIEKNEQEKNEESEANPKKVFVVHGRNEKARQSMFDFLRSIGIEPIEWSEAIKSTEKGAPYVGEVLDKAFNIAQAIVVLVTGDDIARLRNEYIKLDDPDYEKNLTPQPRPNVIFEAGLAFGRNPNRTILVELSKEKTRPFSDIYGRHCVRLTNDSESRFELITRLKTAGCKIDIDGRQDWIKKGDFDGSIVPNAQTKGLEIDKENERLHKENSKLKKELELKKTLFFDEKEGYWEKDKKGKQKDGPFCPRCYESEGKKARLVPWRDGPQRKICIVCRKPFPLKSPKMGKVHTY